MAIDPGFEKAARCLDDPGHNSGSKNRSSDSGEKGDTCEKIDDHNRIIKAADFIVCKLWDEHDYLHPTRKSTKIWVESRSRIEAVVHCRNLDTRWLRPIPVTEEDLKGDGPFTVCQQIVESAQTEYPGLTIKSYTESDYDGDVIDTYTVAIDPD